jgi:biotin synthase-related radical SAM superfamily protein
LESPEFVKIGQASAMSLGLMRGRMYRGAVNRCVNLLVHYPEGCLANCAYCGLAKNRPGTYRDKSFIHVSWPVYPLKEIVDAIRRAPSYMKRACISMITHGKCPQDTLEIARRLKQETVLPVSVLVSPTIMSSEDLIGLKRAGVDKIGVAIDLVTPELFDKYRGRGVAGPHRWEKYWEIMTEGLEVFGRFQVGAHLMVGMGETEQDMVLLMGKLWDLGVVNHLFSFFPEEGSQLAARQPPSWPAYLRIQLARFLIEEGVAFPQDIAFDREGRIVEFGLDDDSVMDKIRRGQAFITTGCLGSDGQVACNRPFGNCLPDVKQWNYPYLPNDEELNLICDNIFKTKSQTLS